MPLYRPAKFGDGLDLEGGTRTITFNEALTGDFTLTNWIVIGEGSATYNGEIVRLENTQTGDYILLKYVASDGKFIGEYKQGENRRVIASIPLSFNTNDFIFYAIQKDCMFVGVQNRDANGVVTASKGPYKF